MISFPSRKTRIPICDSHIAALLDLFIFSDAICSTVAFPPLGNSDHVVVSVSIDVPSNSQRDATFDHIAFDYFHADWDGLHDHGLHVPLTDLFISSDAICSTMAFRPLGNSDHVVVSVSVDVP